jgi:hypothetical protein
MLKILSSIYWHDDMLLFFSLCFENNLLFFIVELDLMNVGLNLILKKFKMRLKFGLKCFSKSCSDSLFVFVNRNLFFFFCRIIAETFTSIAFCEDIVLSFQVCLFKYYCYYYLFIYLLTLIARNTQALVILLIVLFIGQHINGALILFVCKYSTFQQWFFYVNFNNKYCCCSDISMVLFSICQSRVSKTKTFIIVITIEEKTINTKLYFTRLLFKVFLFTIYIIIHIFFLLTRHFSNSSNIYKYMHIKKYHFPKTNVITLNIF